MKNTLALLKEIWEFLKFRKKFWLAPLVFFILLLGILLVAAEGSALAPLIYTIF